MPALTAELIVAWLFGILVGAGLVGLGYQLEQKQPERQLEQVEQDRIFVEQCVQAGGEPTRAGNGDVECKVRLYTEEVS